MLQFSMVLLQRSKCSQDDNRNRLRRLLSQPSGCIPHIHLYGVPGSGVVETLRVLNKQLDQTIMVFLNCFSVEGSAKELLHQISCGFKLKHSKADNISQLLESLSLYVKEHKDKRLVCVLLESQTLNTFTPSFLSAFFDIARQIDNGSFSFITCSHLPWSFFQKEVDSSASEPLQFVFNTPSKGEVIERIATRLGAPPQFVKNCIYHLIPTTSNPNILFNIVRNAYNRVLSDESIVWNTPSGMKNNLEYLDNIVNERNEWNDSRSSHLTSSSRLILISSFCASHNQSGTDKRYFIKGHNKEKMRANGKGQVSKETNPSPKGFDLERLLFIRKALIELYPDSLRKIETNEVEARLLVNSLVSMNRLSLVSAEGNIDWPKLKCVTSFESIVQLAESIGINDIKVHLDHYQ